jgi:hypothetical protein
VLFVAVLLVLGMVKKKLVTKSSKGSRDFLAKSWEQEETERISTKAFPSTPAWERGLSDLNQEVPVAVLHGPGCMGAMNSRICVSSFPDQVGSRRADLQ